MNIFFAQTTENVKENEETETVSKETQTTKPDWVDLSGHEDMVQTENSDVDETEKEEMEVEKGDNEDEDEETEVEDEDEDEKGDNDEDEDEVEETEVEDEDEQYNKDENRQYVCVVYDREYSQQNPDDMTMYIGVVQERNHNFIEVDFGEDGVHYFESRTSFDFSRNTYVDKSGCVVRVHDIRYDYKNFHIIDETFGETEERFVMPTTLQIPSIAAIGYMLFISLVAPVFTTICQNHI